MRSANEMESHSVFRDDIVEMVRREYESRTNVDVIVCCQHRSYGRKRESERAEEGYPVLHLGEEATELT